MPNESVVSSSTDQSESESTGSKHPQHNIHSFKKGKSGNPNGKPKGAMRKATVLREMVKYNLIVSPSLLRRSEAVLQKIVERAEATPTLLEAESPEAFVAQMEAKREAERLIVQYVLTPFIKMQALKSSGIKSESRPTVNINISKAEGLDMNRVIDHGD